MKEPLVSIIIPTYNRERYISQAIDSALNQTYKNIEIIVGDNQSTDNTWKILQQYAEKDNRIIIFQNEQNVGPVLNWDACFKKAKGEYLKIIWSDDWIDVDYIEKTLPIFDRDTAFVLSSICAVSEKKGTTLITKYRKKIYSQKQYLNDIFIANRDKLPVSPGCALFRRSDILSGFIVKIPNKDNLDSTRNGAGNDLLLFLNTAVKYKHIKINEEVKSYFRDHEGSFTSLENLDKYYLWSLIFFLEKNKVNLYSNVLKFRLLFKYIKDKKYCSLYKSIHFTIGFFYAFWVYFISGLSKSASKKNN